MAGGIKVCRVNSQDKERIGKVAGFVFDRYTGGLNEWKPAEDQALWGISFGARAAVVGVDYGGLRCCVKLFYDGRFHVKLRNRLGLAKARRAYFKGVGLERRGISCPRMLGYAVDMAGGQALLVTELIEDGEQVNGRIADNGISAAFTESLAAFVRNLHISGCGHNDLSPRNILVRYRDGEYIYYLLDYEDVVFYTDTPRRRMIKDLHHLNERAMKLATLKERLRFLKCYLRGSDEKVSVWARRLRDYMKKHPSKYTEKEQVISKK
jgi:tRNA A-37 threonylcarbamoyl transferase component Bud32